MLKFPALALCLLMFVLGQARAADQGFTDERAEHRRTYTNNDHGEDGVKFSCGPERLAQIAAKMRAYLDRLGIAPALYEQHAGRDGADLIFHLATPADDVATLDLRFRPEMEIRDELITLPAAGARQVTVLTVSEKEIVLALLQHGRLSEFAGEQCEFQAFRDQVGIRQNTVAWAETLEWVWPDGGRARWNTRLWKNGTPRPGVSISRAVGDAFLNQKKYAIGCYTASKLVMLQGVLDYYARVKHSPGELARVEQRLLANDRDPLVRIEPRALWAFEEGFEASELWQRGKLFEMRYNIPSRNFVPGDWAYLLNTDATTYQKTGYEGSNAIYLGRGLFDDYYNDHNHAYQFREKLDEVYQWRHHVFSRSRDVAKLRPMTESEVEKLTATPQQGGLLIDVRVFFQPSPGPVVLP
ncbi:MAG: hypothetical protein V4508_02750 [Pseudomonadota bacterium]